MTLNKLASAIARAEGKKHQASIGDIREILRILVEMQEKRTDFHDRMCSSSGANAPSTIILAAAWKIVSKENKCKKAKRK